MGAYHWSSLSSWLQASTFLLIWLAVHCILFSLMSLAARSQLSPHFLISGYRYAASSTLSLPTRFFCAGPSISLLSSSNVMLSASILGARTLCGSLCICWSMKALTLSRFLSTWVQAVLRLMIPFLWLVLSRLELFLAFLPINNDNKIESLILYFIMLFVETKPKSLQIAAYSQRTMVESSRSQNCARNAAVWQQQSPEAVICRVLRGLLHRQTRKPFQLLKQFFLFSQEESSIEVGYKHSRLQLQMMEENMRAVYGRIRQRMLVSGFLSIRSLFLKKQAYYSRDNLQILHQSVANFQQFCLKWEGFGRIYEHFRGHRLLKLNLSKIEAISNDYTSRELEDFRPFLTDRTKEEPHLSCLVDHITEHEENSEGRSRRKQQATPISQIAEDFQENNRSLKKSSTAYRSSRKVEEAEETEEDGPATRRKERRREEAESTARPSRIRAHNQSQVQQIYLIRDYGLKKTAPTNYIKVPVLSENLKIVEINTKRRRDQKKRVVRQSVQLMTDICANCKYCLMLRQQKEMVKTISRRLETSRTVYDSTASELWLEK